MYVESFKGLVVWQKSMLLVKEIYLLTNQLPSSEMYCLTNQIRRAAISIPSNIAEGKRRKTISDFLHFLRIADGSAAELETQLIIVQDIYSDRDCRRALALLEEVQKMLVTMIRKLEYNANSSKL